MRRGTTAYDTTLGLPSGFTQAAMALAERKGWDIDQLLRDAGVPPLRLAHPRRPIDPEEVLARLIQAAWRNTGDELLGLAPHPVPRGTLRLLCYGLLTAPDVRHALDRLAGFVKVLPGIPRLQIVIANDTRLDMDMSALDDEEHLLTVSILAVCHRFTGWAIGRRVPLLRVEFPHPRPQNAADYQLVFRAPLLFDAPAASLVMSNNVLDAPIVRSERELTELLRDAPGPLIARREYASTTADHVRRILLRHLGHPVWPASRDLARRMAMSEQTLRRRLAEEGTSYRRIKEDIMLEEALNSLERGDETVASLAARLGFSEPAAFTRAFRRWTGTPPSSYQPPTVG